MIYRRPSNGPRTFGCDCVAPNFECWCTSDRTLWRTCRRTDAPSICRCWAGWRPRLMSWIFARRSVIFRHCTFRGTLDSVRIVFCTWHRSSDRSDTALLAAEWSRSRWDNPSLLVWWTLPLRAFQSSAALGRSKGTPDCIDQQERRHKSTWATTLYPVTIGQCWRFRRFVSPRHLGGSPEEKSTSNRISGLKVNKYTVMAVQIEKSWVKSQFNTVQFGWRLYKNSLWVHIQCHDGGGVNSLRIDLSSAQEYCFW